MNRQKTVFGVAALVLLSGCLAEKDAYDMKPEASDSTLTAVEWQTVSDADLAAEMRPEMIELCTSSCAVADAFLASVKGAYETGPLTATKIAAVTQAVMDPSAPNAAARRELWRDALLRAAERTADDYRAQFFLEQLRWCGTRADVARVRAVGLNRGRSVRDFAAVVARELERESM